MHTCGQEPVLFASGLSNWETPKTVQDGCDKEQNLGPAWSGQPEQPAPPLPIGSERPLPAGRLSTTRSHFPTPHPFHPGLHAAAHAPPLFGPANPGTPASRDILLVAGGDIAIKTHCLARARPSSRISGQRWPGRGVARVASAGGSGGGGGRATGWVTSALVRAAAAASRELAALRRVAQALPKAGRGPGRASPRPPTWGPPVASPGCPPSPSLPAGLPVLFPRPGPISPPQAVVLPSCPWLGFFRDFAVAAPCILGTSSDFAPVVPRRP